VTTEAMDLKVHDRHFDNYPVDMPLDVLLGKPPKMTRNVVHEKIEQALERVLRLPAVANKTFLISIGDRSVTPGSDGGTLAGAGSGCGGEHDFI